MYRGVGLVLLHRVHHRDHNYRYAYSIFDHGDALDVAILNRLH